MPKSSRIFNTDPDCLFLARLIKNHDMIQVGEFNTMKVLRLTDIGAYLDDGRDGILLPKRFLPRNISAGDDVEAFIYHDSEGRLIATTQQPKGRLGDFVKLQVVTVTNQGAFLDWGLMKDLFVPKSKQITGMRVGGEYLVRIYIDEQTGRLVASEKLDAFLSNEDLTVKPLDEVELVVYRRTDIGYLMIINKIHTGVLHFNEIYQEIGVGDQLKGFVKNISEDNKIDVVLGKAGYQRVSSEAEKVLSILKDNNGYLPFNDKSDPEDIYVNFGMSKKTFKMATGSLYKQRLITFTQTGIKITEE